MNEQLIKDLARKAGLIAPYGSDREGLRDFDYRMFAELIVKECALVAKTLPHTPERHWVQDSVTYIPVHCEQNILKHFGVEE